MTDGPAHDSGAAERGRVRPLRTLGLWSIGLLGAWAASYLLVTISEAQAMSAFDRARQAPQLGEQEFGADPWLAGVGLALTPLVAVVFLTWLWRARRNSELLCAARHSRSIGWVVGAWVCPIVCFWFPRVVVADVVRASRPDTPADATSLRGRPAGALVNLWWLACLAAMASNLTGLRLGMPKTTATTAGGVQTISVGPAGWGMVVSDFVLSALLVAAAALLAGVIINVGRWQHESELERFPSASDPEGADR